jgi:hypothetical protein
LPLFPSWSVCYWNHSSEVLVVIYQRHVCQIHNYWVMDTWAKMATVSINNILNQSYTSNFIFSCCLLYYGISKMTLRINFF